MKTKQRVIALIHVIKKACVVNVLAIIETEENYQHVTSQIILNGHMIEL